MIFIGRSGRVNNGYERTELSDDSQYGSQQDSNVGQQVALHLVVQRELELVGKNLFDILLLHPAGREHLVLAAICEGCGIGDAGTFLQNDGVLGAKHLHVGFDLRASTDQLHLAFQDVKQLWKLIELVSPQETSDHGQAGVRGGREQTMPVGTRNHAAKLAESKGLKTLTNSNLPVKNGAAIIKLDSKGDETKQRRQKK